MWGRKKNKCSTAKEREWARVWGLEKDTEKHDSGVLEKMRKKQEMSQMMGVRIISGAMLDGLDTILESGTFKGAGRVTECFSKISSSSEHSGDHRL